MKMVPFFAPDGRLLGHVDVLMYPLGPDYIVVDDQPRGIPSLTVNAAPEDTYNIFRIPLMKIPFRCGEQETKVSHFVIDQPTPAWLWDAYGIVKFDAESWRP